MSDGINDGWPFMTPQERTLSEEEWHRLLRAHVKLGYQKDADIHELQEEILKLLERLDFLKDELYQWDPHGNPVKATVIWAGDVAISQEDYDKLAKENQELKAKLAEYSYNLAADM